MNKRKRIISITMMIAIIFSFMPLISGEAFAASRKKPSAPIITTLKEKTTVNDGTHKVVNLKWKKAKNAKYYQVAIRSTKKKWVKVNTVKKNARNKKKYTKKNKYKVVAKGNKYIVYQYKYTFVIKGETKNRSYRLANGSCHGRFSEVVIKPSTTYTFAVRSVNGRKYSAWSTAKIRISAGHVSKTLKKSGQSVTSTVNGKKTKIIIGKKCVLPVTNPNKELIEAKSFSMTPTKIEYISEYLDYKLFEDISVTGKSSDGETEYWSACIYDGALENTSYCRYDPKVKKNWDKYASVKYYAGSGGPSSIKKRVYKVNDSNITIVWTVDGTEPTLEQEDKTIKAKDYPLDKITGYDNNLEMLVRGTASYGEPSTIWESTPKVQFNHCEWLKMYKGNKLVFENFEKYIYE